MFLPSNLIINKLILIFKLTKLSYVKAKAMRTPESKLSMVYTFKMATTHASRTFSKV